jgi:histidyl-tRNA synthetase
MDAITAIKGFKDILPGETEKWQYIENMAREIFADFGVRELKVPILEKTDLFIRGIGEATDIVEKEMYSFVDRGDERLSLRPEATASVIRAYIEHSMHASEPVSKLFTIGPMFRRERPQKGRFRQFHQINVEVLGLDDPSIDAELILMLVHFLKSVDLTAISLEINSLGCPNCRTAFREKITSYLLEKEPELCPDCVRRLRTNPLRIFDCKVEGCRKALESAPTLLEFICSECSAHFGAVQEYLGIFDVPFEVNPRMVRGLDYYTRTAFEVTTTALGAQNAVAGGGRYNGLVKELGGPDIPGIGFAIGLERLAALIPISQEELAPGPDLFIAPLGDVARVWAFSVCNYLRMLGIRTEMGYGDKSLKSQMKRSNKLKSRTTLILGENEINEGAAELRDMAAGTQEKVSLENFDQLAELIMTKTRER